MLQERRGRRPVPFALITGVVTGCAATVLTGCGGGGENPLGLPSLGSVVATSNPVAGPGASAAAASPSGQTSTGNGQPGGSPGDAVIGPDTGSAGTFGAGADAELGSLTGSARSQQLLVRSVVAYMDVRVRIANSWQVDESALAVVATGQAARSARQRATVMQSGRRHTVGSYVVNASRVRIKGDRAAVTGCMVDHTSEVDGAGQVLVDPPGGRKVTIRLERAQGAWLVSDVPTTAPPFCLET